MPTSESLVFLAAKRTPFGTFGGELKDVHPTDLCVAAGRSALEASGVSPEEIQHVIVGNVLHSVAESIYVPRHTGLKLSVPIPVPALGINRLCGSGFQAVIEAFQQMRAGDTEVALVGGVENMSQSPYVLRGARWGLRMGHAPVTDLTNESLYDAYPQMPMAITAENLAVKYGISREECDRFALRSQTRMAEAQGAKRFDAELAAVEIKDRKGQVSQIRNDTHPRAGTTAEILAKLKPVFKKDGVVTAGNASGIVDGAAMLVVATESFASKRGLKPLGRMVAYGVVGCEPSIMGIGPVGATQIALKRAGWKLSDLDLIEVNEAFAAQTLAVQKELEIPDEILNVDGGAIAVGHPLGASGARITAHLLHELRRRGKKKALGTACIGGGQGIALLVEAF